MKKLLFVILCAVLTLSLFACGTNNNDNEPSDEDTASHNSVTSSVTSSVNNDSSASVEEKTYKVTLILDGGTIANDKTVVDVVYGKNYDLGTPEKDEYAFLGWYKNDTPIETSGVWLYDEDMTLTARWEYAWSPTV